MQNVIIVDDMKKEAKKLSIPMTVILLLSTILPLMWYLCGDMSTDVLVQRSIFCICALIYGLYVFLSCVKYKLVVTKERIFVNTLFRVWNFDIAVISSYTYRRHRKSEIYRFLLVINRKKICINTRYPNQLIALFDANQIPYNKTQ